MSEQDVMGQLALILDEVRKNARRLDLIDSRLILVSEQGASAMALLDALTAEVANNTTVEGSVVSLVNNLAAQIAANTANPAALAALVTQLQNNDAALAAAVTANTPPPVTPVAPAVVAAAMQKARDAARK